MTPPRASLAAIIISTFLCANALVAQGADLALKITHAGSITPPGARGIMSITVTNLGPGSAGESPLGLDDVNAFTEITFKYPDGIGIPVDFTRVVSGECFILVLTPDPAPGFDPSIVYSVNFDKLAEGEQQTCEIEFKINPAVTDSAVETLWRVFAIPLTDPNPANDRATVVFPTRAAIPTLSSIGLIAMITALALAALVLQRRRRVS